MRREARLLDEEGLKKNIECTKAYIKKQITEYDERQKGGKPVVQSKGIPINTAMPGFKYFFTNNNIIFRKPTPEQIAAVQELEDFTILHDSEKRAIQFTYNSENSGLEDHLAPHLFTIPKDFDFFTFVQDESYRASCITVLDDTFFSKSTSDAIIIEYGKKKCIKGFDNFGGEDTFLDMLNNQWETRNAHGEAALEEKPVFVGYGPWMIEYACYARHSRVVAMEDPDFSYRYKRFQKIFSGKQIKVIGEPSRRLGTFLDIFRGEHYVDYEESELRLDDIKIIASGYAMPYFRYTPCYKAFSKCGPSCSKKIKKWARSTKYIDISFIAYSLNDRYKKYIGLRANYKKQGKPVVVHFFKSYR